MRKKKDKWTTEQRDSEVKKDKQTTCLRKTNEQGEGQMDKRAERQW